MKKDELQCELGSNFPVTFLQPKLYDSDDKEIEVPKCEKCGSYKSPLIGRESFIWICLGCNNEKV